MSRSTCTICLEPYSQSATPRSLPCGHCCCSPCLSKILESTMVCHLCKKALLNSDIAKYPIMFSLLEASEGALSSSRKSSKVRQRWRTAVDKHGSIVTAATIEFTEKDQAMSLSHKNKLHEVDVESGNLIVETDRTRHLGLDKVELDKKDNIDNVNIDNNNMQVQQNKKDYSKNKLDRKNHTEVEQDKKDLMEIKPVKKDIIEVKQDNKDFIGIEQQNNNVEEVQDKKEVNEVSTIEYSPDSNKLYHNSDHDEDSSQFPTKKAIVPVCLICLKSYSQTTPPRVFPCGHCCCSACMVNILESTMTCYSCRKPCSNSDINQYPIMFSILEACEELSDSSHNSNSLRQRLEAVKEKHEQILAAASMKLTEEGKVAAMIENQNKLLELNAKDDKDLEEEEVSVTLDDVEQLMHDVAKILSGESNSDYRIDYHSSKFGNSGEFLNKIYDEVHQGNSIEAHKVVKGEEKFSKLSADDTKVIFIHALRSSKMEDKSKLVKFDDLNQTFAKYEYLGKMRAFFDLKDSASGSSARIFVGSFVKSHYTNLFLKMCTGEMGSSYIGCKSALTTDGRRSKILGFISKPELKWGAENSTSLPQLPPDFDQEDDSYFISFSLTGAFDVLRYWNQCDDFYVIGTVSNRDVLDKLESRTYEITDCGIARTL